MTPALPRQVVVEMARRSHRFHHYLWHRVRNSWLRLTDRERQAIYDINSEWVPPRPALDAMRRPVRDNDSGEDFLFMHRQMIAHVNNILTRVNDPFYPRIEGWRRVPPPDDDDYPVPEFSDSELEKVKSLEYFYQFIAQWERQYTDQSYLRKVTLGQLGSDMEFTIHNDIHMRFAAPSPIGYRPSTSSVEEIDEQWDAPAYDYLGDTYSSHVNPIFWKLHGWMDERIEDWKWAHGITGEIEWKGTWLGTIAHYNKHPHVAPPIAAMVATSSDAQDEVKQIDKIISGSGAREFDGFFRQVVRRPCDTAAAPRSII